MNKKTRKRAYPTTVAVFALCVILVCFFVFLVNYYDAYDHTAGGDQIIPSSWAVHYYFFLITVVSLVIAGFAELIIDLIDKRVRIWPLFLCAALLPSACFGTFYFSFQKGGTLYPLVEHGGPLSFIVEGDYNRNGYIDEYEKQYSETYETTLHHNVNESDEVVNDIWVRVTGRGFIHTHTDISYDENERSVTVGLEKGQVEYDEIVISVVFEDSDMRNKLLVYRIVDGERVLQNYSVFPHNKAEVVITGDMISELIAESVTDAAEIKFIFVVDKN